MMKKLIKNSSLKDVWQVSRKDREGFTYVDGRTNTKSRLDYIMMTDVLANHLADIKLNEIVFIPDHLAVSATVRTHCEKRGPNYWKLNSNILKEETYIHGVKSERKKVEKEYAEMLNCKQLFGKF